MKECCSLDMRDKENLDSIAGALVDVLSVLRRRTITPSAVAADSVTIDREKRKNPGRSSLKIPFEVLEELRGLGFTWTRIVEMPIASRWTVHRRVAEYYLQDMRGSEDLPDVRLDEIFYDNVNNHGSASGCNIIGGYLKSFLVYWLTDSTSKSHRKVGEARSRK